MSSLSLSRRFKDIIKCIENKIKSHTHNYANINHKHPECTNRYFINSIHTLSETLPSYVYLGRWSETNDANVLVLDAYIGDGWNGCPAQNTHKKLFIKRGWKAPTPDINIAYGCTVYTYSTKDDIHDDFSTVQVKAIDFETCDVYLVYPPSTGHRYTAGMYTINCMGGKWTHAGTVSNTVPSGIMQPLQNNDTSLLTPHHVNYGSTLSTNRSVWRGNITDGIVVWGQNFKDTTLTNDTGDITLWLNKAGAYSTLNLSIDGSVYVSGNREVATKDHSHIIAKSLRQNGYIKYDSGLIIQWGNTGGAETIDGVVYYKVPLNIVFSDTTYIVNVTGVTSTVTSNRYDNISYKCINDLKTTQKFNVLAINSNNISGGAPGSINWIAIGY